MNNIYHTHKFYRSINIYTLWKKSQQNKTLLFINPWRTGKELLKTENNPMYQNTLMKNFELCYFYLKCLIMVIPGSNNIAENQHPLEQSECFFFCAMVQGHE